MHDRKGQGVHPVCRLMTSHCTALEMAEEMAVAEEAGQKWERNPDMDLAQKLFMLTERCDSVDLGEVRKAVMEKIKRQSMAPFYVKVCQDLSESPDVALLDSLKETNRQELARLDEAVRDAEENLGDVEQREALLARAEYLSAIGDKEEAEAAFCRAFDKTVPLGQRLDILFHQIRLGLFFVDHNLITRDLSKAKSLMEEGGDWDRKNRLRIYEGLYALSTRNFAVAATNFFDTMATFTCSEMMSYHTFVKYAVFACMVAMDRSFIKEKIVGGAEVLEVLHSHKELGTFVQSFYNCQYDVFFKMLVWVEGQVKHDRFLAPHCQFYIREMRIKAYSQLLESYRSLSLQAMADTFGVTPAFIDRELSRFIAMGRLNCRIDKVGGVVETNRPDRKNFLYQSTIKQGDLLLNRLQKLGRIINI